jgi:hypothetical protein
MLQVGEQRRRLFGGNSCEFGEWGGGNSVRACALMEKGRRELLQMAACGGITTSERVNVKGSVQSAPTNL